MKSKLLLVSLSLVLAQPALAAQVLWTKPGDIQITAASIPDEIKTEKAHKFDERIQAAMQKWQIPGGQLAIARNGNVVYAHAFGYADLDTKTPAQPDSLFRIASLSKCITSIAIMKLVEDGKLKLSDKVFQLLPNMVPVKSEKSKGTDPRLLDLTVKDLLDMAPGWDRKKRGEPLLMPKLKSIAYKCETLTPPPLETICQHELRKKFEWTPGTHYSYSNLSYALLGQLISNTVDEDYPDYCQNHLFKPLLLPNIQSAGRLPTQRLSGEVKYYPSKISSKKKSIFTVDLDKKLPAPYGQVDIERYTSSFGWVSDASSILKFLHAAIHDSSILKPESVSQLLTRPSAVDWAKSKNYVAGAFLVSSNFAEGKADLFKDGTLPGTRAFLISYPDGTSCCALFNARPEPTKSDPFRAEIISVFDLIKKELQ